jgi:hypothetical protein
VTTQNVLATKDGKLAGRAEKPSTNHIFCSRKLNALGNQAFGGHYFRMISQFLENVQLFLSADSLRQPPSKACGVKFSLCTIHIAVALQLPLKLKLKLKLPTEILIFVFSHAPPSLIEFLVVAD